MMSISSLIVLGVNWFALVGLYLMFIWVMLKSNGHSV